MDKDYTATETHLQAARRMFMAGHNDSALNQILWHLEPQAAPSDGVWLKESKTGCTQCVPDYTSIEISDRQAMAMCRVCNGEMVAAWAPTPTPQAGS